MQNALSIARFRSKMRRTSHDETALIDMIMEKRATAKAHSNIALAKYWGKYNVDLNLPAVPSLSMTLDRFWTETSVHLDSALKKDDVFLDGKAAHGLERQRIVKLLDYIRMLAKSSDYVRVISSNNFPTASGLASSASGFAALAAAASRCFGLDLNQQALSALARRASASAARSVFGGFVELPRAKRPDPAHCARPIAESKNWPVCLVIAHVGEGRKAIGSTQAMEHSRNFSPYYEAWLKTAPRYFDTVRSGVVSHDLPLAGSGMEQSTFAMHSCVMAAEPPVIFWRAGTMQVIERVQQMRKEDGLDLWCTMDAGPHVKILCYEEQCSHLTETLKELTEVSDVSIARPGPALSFLE